MLCRGSALFRIGWRFIHARPSQTKRSELRRKTQREVEHYRSPGKADGSMTKSDSRILLMPTSPEKHAERSGRSSKTSKQRYHMQMSKSPGELLQHLQQAVNKGLIDPSVFAAAMQRCGQGNWFDALQKVRAMQLQTGLTVNAICRNIFLTALAKSVRGGDDSQLRRSQILRLAQAMWEEVPPTSDGDTFRSGLGAAMKVCSVAGCDKSMEWAESLWSWAQEQPFTLGSVAYSSFAGVLERHGLHGRVDRLLEEMADNGWSISVVSLGALVDAAGERYDWRRAEKLWEALTCNYGVTPNELAYGSLAKAHLLCGRPTHAGGCIEDLETKGFQLHLHTADILVQARLIVYHSSLFAADLIALKRDLGKAKPVMQGFGKSQAERLKAMQDAARRTETRPRAVRLHDTLVNSYAKKSVMIKWTNYASGSKYLDDTRR